MYQAKLPSASGWQAVFGRPHAAWTAAAAEKTQHMNPRVYLTCEARAWYTQQKWVEINQDKFCSFMVDVETRTSLKLTASLSRTWSSKGVAVASATATMMLDAACTPQQRSRKNTCAMWNSWTLSHHTSVFPAATATAAEMEKCWRLSASQLGEAEQALIEESIKLDTEDMMVWLAIWGPLSQTPSIWISAPMPGAGQERA